MRGYLELKEHTQRLLEKNNEAAASILSVLILKVALIEKSLLVLVSREREELNQDRRDSIKLDNDLAVIQSNLQSSSNVLKWVENEPEETFEKRLDNELAIYLDNHGENRAT